MKLTIIHLSDIHIKKTDSGIINESIKISNNSFDSARNSDRTIIVITGDIAFSGERCEYEIAEKFISNIKLELEKEIGKNVSVFMVPGNHDCELKKPNQIRDIIVKEIIENKTTSDEVISACVQAQDNYFEFRKKINDSDIILDENLWTECQIVFFNKKINISLINVAWMSTINEKQGTLVFPIERYKETLKNECDYRITLLHHPLNWYCQSTYHDFRSTIQHSSTVIFSGHEHTSETYNIKTAQKENTIFLESPSLVPHSESDKAGYSIVELDFENENIIKKNITINKGDHILDGDISIYSINKNKKYISLNEGFLSILNDTGAAIYHPSKKDFNINDFFVEPELKYDESGESILLKDLELIGKKTKITGEEQSGKTKLLHHLFCEMFDSGVFPVYVDAKLIKRTTKNEIEKVITKSISTQYNDPSELLKISKTKKSILIDNFDNIGSLNKGLDTIIDYLESNYDTIVISFDTILESAFTSSVVQNDFMQNYQSMKIKDFGSNSRNKLIKKWHELSDGVDFQNFEKKIHKTELVINTVLGKNLIPSRPLYLLTLLQSTATNEAENLHNSGMSYYYQYLITKSLEEAGVGRSSFDEIFNYISQLSWYYKENDSDELNEIELQRFNNDFSAKFTTVNINKQLNILVKSKILSENEGYYSFTYPYIKFFFLGKYLADYIDTDNVKELIESCCNNLSTRENSNAILFLTHHRNAEWVIDKVAENLKNTYKGFKPMVFSGEKSFFNDIIGTLSELVISDESLNVIENQTVKRDFDDSNEYELSDNELSGGDVNEGIIEFFNFIRSTEVLGQILKNYYGSLNREDKKKYIKIISDAPLRLLGYLFNSLENAPEKLIKEIESEADNEIKDISKSKVNDIATKIISEIVRGISTGVILKTAESLGSEKLIEEVEDFAKYGNNAYKLIQVAIYLISPNRLPLDKIKSIIRDVDSSNLAFDVIQNLSAYHIHMFHTPDKQKQKLGSLVKINFQPKLNRIKDIN